MTEINDAQFLNTSVGAFADQFRGLTSKLTKVERVAGEQQLTPGVADQVLALVRGEMVSSVNRLLLRWGCDVRSSSPRMLSSAMLPRGAEQEKQFCADFLQFVMLSTAHALILRDLPSTPANQRGPVAMKAVAEAIGSLPQLVADSAKNAPFESGRSDSMLATAGWARANLSVNSADSQKRAVNQRVKHAAETEDAFVGEGREQALRQMLPASVALALDESDLADWNPKALLNRVAKEVEAFLPEQRQRTKTIRVSSLNAFVDDQVPDLNPLE